MEAALQGVIEAPTDAPMVDPARKEDLRKQKLLEWGWERDLHHIVNVSISNIRRCQRKIAARPEFLTYECCSSIVTENFILLCQKYRNKPMVVQRGEGKKDGPKWL